MNIIHAANPFPPADVQTKRRMTFAASTWKKLGWTQRFYLLDKGEPSSTDIGDARAVPYLHKVIDHAVLGAAPGASSAIVYTNMDIAVVPEASKVIRDAVGTFGCFYSHRVDVHRFYTQMTMKQLQRYTAYIGADLFAFSVPWWEANKASIPNLFLGYEGWDHVMKRTMQRSGFPPAGTHVVVYHEAHQAYWKSHIGTSPGQEHNRRLCRQWAMENGFAADLDKCPPFLF